MKLKEGMVCPVCEAGELKAVTKDVPFEYKGHGHVVGNVRGFDCPTCGESLWDERDEREIEKSLTDARRKIDGLLTSDEIRTIRKLFGMTQIEFARALDIGEKNFARYESGQSTQGRAMDHVLRMLQADPQNLGIIYRAWKGWASERQEMTVPVRRRRSRKVFAPLLTTRHCEGEEGQCLYESAL
jgi:HTH-type transcriptional regulator / antitoxin MqsA